MGQHDDGVTSPGPEAAKHLTGVARERWVSTGRGQEGRAVVGEQNHPAERCRGSAERGGEVSGADEDQPLRSSSAFEEDASRSAAAQVLAVAADENVTAIGHRSEVVDQPLGNSCLREARRDVTGRPRDRRPAMGPVDHGRMCGRQAGVSRVLDDLSGAAAVPAEVRLRDEDSEPGNGP